LLLRNIFEGAIDPPGTSGGWGSVRETVPFWQDMATLTYQVSLAGLGDHGDGQFSYNIQAFSFGVSDARNWVGCASGSSGLPSMFCTDTNPPIIGAPEFAWPMLLGFMLLAGFLAWRHRRRLGVELAQKALNERW
jgi:hypothetical protein